MTIEQENNLRLMVLILGGFILVGILSLVLATYTNINNTVVLGFMVIGLAVIFYWIISPPKWIFKKRTVVRA